MHRHLCLGATALVVVTGCAEPCVDDGINQEQKEDEECPAITGGGTQSGTETESVSESMSESISATMTDATMTMSASDATETEDATLTDATADTTEGTGECPVLDITVAMEDPIVILLLDQSASMTADFGGDTRWNTLRNTILDPDIGVVVWFETQVIFGLSLYSNTEADPACPELVTVPPMEMGYDAIAEAFDGAAPADDTPTGDSITAVVQYLEENPMPNPKYIVLATDGEPDTCELPDPEQGQEESVAAAAAAYEAGIPTYVLSVGTDTSEEHLQDVANAGAGVMAGDPDAPFYVAIDQNSLAQAFLDIIGGTQDCKFDLDSPLMEGAADTCVLNVNGSAVPIDDPNGWQPTGPSEIELLGSACDAIQEAEATVEMVCQCEAVEGG
jgi:hypothetical protein